MNAPKTIFLQVCGDCPKADCENCKFEDITDAVTWCAERIFDSDVKYIRKDAVVALIEGMCDNDREELLDKINKL